MYLTAIIYSAEDKINEAKETMDPSSTRPITQEDEIIINLVSVLGTKKWTTVAEQMNKAMAKSTRSSKQIRERWHNHLDPTVSKKEWSRQEETVLFESHRAMGSRWKEIANKLQGRTDNHVKNYFYSTMRRALRRVNKFLGSKNSTTQMRAIRPSILSYLLDIADTDAEIRILVSKILEFSKLKPKKGNHFTLLDKDKKDYKLAIAKLMEINEIYSKKGSRKLSQKQNIKVIEKTQQSLQLSTRIKQQEILQKHEHQSQLSQQQQQQQQLGCEQKSWSDEAAQSYNCQLMPEIQKPEYQCDLLSKKQQTMTPPMHAQLCPNSECLWGVPMVGGQAIAMFEF